MTSPRFPHSPKQFPESSLYGYNRADHQKTTTEVIEYWIREREQEAIAERALDLLKKERHLGKHLYKTRQDIHDR
jgi:hypothetical protein